jgi:hypothetical protein
MFCSSRPLCHAPLPEKYDHAIIYPFHPLLPVTKINGLILGKMISKNIPGLLLHIYISVCHASQDRGYKY